MRPTRRGWLPWWRPPSPQGCGASCTLSFPGVEKAIGTPLERAKLAAERLRGSSLQRVIIRSDAFQEIHFGAAARFDVAAGKIAIIGRGDSKRRWVSTGDIAALVASVAVEPDPPSLITVGGPEAMTKNEAVAFVEKVTGRRMKVQHMPRPVARLAIRLLNKRNDALASPSEPAFSRTSALQIGTTRRCESAASHRGR